ETGILPFATPARLFDAGFPGHYLRLIKRVRTSVIALIPPVQGIRATLVTSGISRCVVGGDIFQEIVIRREPEVVALTSPMNATGIFELDTQPDMLLPFESMGVDTSWEFQMPRTANSFDFNTITDILVTIEYTALNSFDYRQQVIKKLNPQVNSDRAFSFRREFADAWYDLHHNETAGQPLSVTFEVLASDFPPNLDRGSLSVDEILMYFVRSPGQKSSILWNDDDWEAQLSHTFVSPNGAQLTIPVTPAEAKARPLDGAISTKRGNAAGWRKLTGAGTSPVGIWTLTLPDEANVYFQAGMLEDILFVITFAGRTPPWPA
ncbi:MAG: hypothetical protein H3C63_11145, partial [Candidatus Omnitrophica bacterium]|nr:hypothetical protein [Candidatus Omnitrophota bacterium]